MWSGCAKSLVDQAYENKDCRSFTDFREALEWPGLDAVMISTPDHWHAIQSLIRGVACDAPSG